jgi:hypothetical protein
MGVADLTPDERGKCLEQAIDALKFAHDSVDGVCENAKEAQSAMMGVIESLSIERMALDAEQGKIAHG